MTVPKEARTPNVALRRARRALGLSQADFAHALQRAGWASCDRRTIQRYESGAITNPRYLSQRALSAVTMLPFEELGFPPEEEEEQDVNRRQLLTLTATGLMTGIGAEPFDRLNFVLQNHRAPDAAIVDHLEVTTAGLFDEEELVPGCALPAKIDEHVNLLTLMVSNARDPRLRRRLTIAAGEACALAGWVAYDIGDTGQARKWWDTASTAAKAVDDGPLGALVLTYLSYLLGDQGDSRGAWQALDAASKHVRDRDQATARAWISARQAEEAATLGDASALFSLDRAMTVMDYAQPGGRPWVRFFDNARLGALGIATYAKLGHPELGPAADAVLRSVREDAKTRGIILADVASAQIKRGDLDQGYDLAEQALHAVDQSETIVGRQRLRALVPMLERRSPKAKQLRGQIEALPA